MKVSPLTKTIVAMTAAGAAYVWVQKRKNAMSVEVAHPVEIHGFVTRGYEAVREAFAENFLWRRELGAACCVYHRGEKVIDLWFANFTSQRTPLSVGFLALGLMIDECSRALKKTRIGKLACARDNQSYSCSFYAGGIFVSDL